MEARPPCRLCLKSNESLDSARVNLLENADAKKLLLDVYELEIQPNDQYSTVMCIPCYQQLIKNYTLRMTLLMLRKTFRINQTVLLAQKNEFRDTLQEHNPSMTAEDDATSKQDKTTQTEETLPATIEKMLEELPEESNVTEPPSSAAKATSEKVQKQLVPVVMDCLKEPLFVDAIWPLVVSTGWNAPASLMFLCSTCYKTFNDQEKFEQHQSKVKCVPCCRYCLSELTGDHCCPRSKKYKSIITHILGSSKYVTNPYVIPVSDDASAEPGVSDEPRKKNLKHSERVSSVERRSVTPNLRKRIRSSGGPSSSTTKNPEPPEIDSQPDRTATNLDLASAITISSSDDETLSIVFSSNLDAFSKANRGKKRKRSTK